MADPELKVIISADDKASSTLTKINSSLGNLSTQALKVGAALEGMAVGIAAAIFKMTDSYANSAEELVNMNAKTGMSVESLSELKYITDLVGLDMSDIQMAVKGVSNILEEATAGSKAATEKFEALGLSIEDIMAMSPEERFWAIANAIASVSDANMRAAYATDFFGRSGMNLLPVLAKGSAELEKERQKAHELGITMTTEGAKGAAELHDSLETLHESIKGLGNTIGEIFRPELEKIVNNITKIVLQVKAWADAHPELIKRIETLAIILGIGGALFLAFAAILKMIMMVNAAIIAMKILLEGPLGIAEVAAALAAALLFVGAITIGVGKIMGATTPTETTATVESHQYGGVVRGGPMGSPKLVMAHVGEEFAGVGGRVGGDLHVHIGTLIADEPSQRKLARTLKQLMDEDTRRTSFRGINRGYYYGGSNV